MNHSLASLHTVATIGLAAVISVSTAAASADSRAESATRDANLAVPFDGLPVRTGPAPNLAADLPKVAEHQEARIARPVENAELPSLDGDCGRTAPSSGPLDDRRLAQLANRLALSGDQMAELQAIQMLADDRFTPHISQTDLDESFRTVVSDDRADCLIDLLRR